MLQVGWRVPRSGHGRSLQKHRWHIARARQKGARQNLCSGKLLGDFGVVTDEALAPEHAGRASISRRVVHAVACGARLCGREGSHQRRIGPRATASHLCFPEVRLCLLSA